MRTVISFSCDTRGQGRAAGNVGVPVLWGLGGGSGAGDSFHSPVLFRPGAVESYASARPGICSKVVIFRLVLVDFVAGSSWSELLSHVVRNLLTFAPDSRLCGSGEARREVHPFFRHVL